MPAEIGRTFTGVNVVDCVCSRAQTCLLRLVGLLLELTSLTVPVQGLRRAC